MAKENVILGIDPNEEKKGVSVHRHLVVWIYSVRKKKDGVILLLTQNELLKY